MKSELPRRPLGSTGMAITTVGFGAWATGGGGWSYGWGPQDDSNSIAAMRRAIELGVNWIDTAPVYGLGHSEEVVGRLLRSVPLRERPLVFTKCGLVWDGSNRMTEPQRMLKPSSIRAECEASLHRLAIERIDLYQFHWPDETGTAIEDSWAEMVRLVEEGKVRSAGVSNFDASLLERCEAVRHVDSLQPPFSMIRRGAAKRVAAMAGDDWRRRSAEFQSPNLKRNLALRDALRPIAARHSTTVCVVAVAWTLSWPGVTGAIVGARSPAQVDGWISAATLVLTAADLHDISRAIQSTHAGSGPSMPRLKAA
jgi:aryl-alcohol dehydrogenase-like predicted oxidoreductase